MLVNIPKDLTKRVSKLTKMPIKGEMDGLSDWSLSLIEASRDAVKHLCWLFSMTFISEMRSVLNIPNFSIRLVEGITGYQNEG